MYNNYYFILKDNKKFKKINMIYIFFLLLILINISIEDSVYDDFPFNKEFNIINQDEENNMTIIFDGNILTFFKIRNKDSQQIQNVSDCSFDFIKMNFTYQNYEVKFCKNHNESERDYDMCIEEYSVSYGEHIYIRYIYLPFLLVFFGILICLYGRTHFIFGIFLEFMWFIYFFVVDSIQLFKPFDNGVIPFYILCASLISGFMLSIFGNLTKKHSLILTIFNIIIGCLIGFFFMKTILYYISIFAPINTVIYLILSLLFMLLGGLGELYLSMKFKINNILYIIISALSGSTFIVRGISYIVGGYFSDSLTSNYKLEYGKEAKLRVIFFLILHIILIIASLIFQIIDTKNNNFLDESSNENNKRKVKNGDKKDINKNEEDEDNNNNTLSFKEGTSGFQSEKSGNIIQNSNDDNSEFDDQDD